MINVCFAEDYKLGYDNGDWLGTYGIYAPDDGIRFGFQSMDNKVKDGLVLSVVWR